MEKNKSVMLSDDEERLVLGIRERKAKDLDRERRESEVSEFMKDLKNTIFELSIERVEKLCMEGRVHDKDMADVLKRALGRWDFDREPYCGASAKEKQLVARVMSYPHISEMLKRTVDYRREKDEAEKDRDRRCAARQAELEARPLRSSGDSHTF